MDSPDQTNLLGPNASKDGIHHAGTDAGKGMSRALGYWMSGILATDIQLTQHPPLSFRTGCGIKLPQLSIAGHLRPQRTVPVVKVNTLLNGAALLLPPIVTR